MAADEEPVSLYKQFPETRYLPYLMIAISAIFVLAQTVLVSFDIRIHIYYDLLVTHIKYDGDVKEYSIAHGVIRMLTPQGKAGHIYPEVAILLLCWSGIWPHLKLYLMHRTMNLEMTMAERGKQLQWLGALGKFSLLDVFVVVLIAAALQFTHLGNDTNYAVGRARNGVYVFCSCVFASQILSGYILTLHSKHFSEHIASKAETGNQGSLVGNSRWGIAAVVLAILAMIGYVPGMFDTTYIEHTKVHLAPIADIDRLQHLSLWGTIVNCWNNPVNEFWHRTLAVIGAILGLGIPFVHMISVIILCFAPLDNMSRIKWSTVVEIIAEWAALDVFIVALIPVCLEIGPMTSTLAHNMIKNSMTLQPLVLSVAIVACVLGWVAHFWCIHGIHSLVVPPESEATPLLGTETKD